MLRGTWVLHAKPAEAEAARARRQESRVVRVIKKQLVKRALDMLREVAERPDAEGKPSDYNTLWESFGKFIKLGAIEDSANKCARWACFRGGHVGLCWSPCRRLLSAVLRSQGSRALRSCVQPFVPAGCCS